MKEQIIGIKQLYTNLKEITDKAMKGDTFLVIKNSKPAFRIEPVDHVCEQKYNLKDFQEAQFKVEDKNLSKKIDEIIYSRI
jgi:hypothetical protein